jgi:hypothetical protein
VQLLSQKKNRTSEISANTFAHAQISFERRTFELFQFPNQLNVCFSHRRYNAFSFHRARRDGFYSRRASTRRARCGHLNLCAFESLIAERAHSVMQPSLDLSEDIDS